MLNIICFIASSNSSTNLSTDFVVKFEYNLFENGGKVYVDDKLVDSKYYTSKEGSTIITFTREYMDNLDLGPHTLRVEFKDGGDASCVFRVAVLKYKAGQKTYNPITYDNIVTFIMVLSLSLLGILIIGLETKRRKMS